MTANTVTDAIATRQEGPVEIMWSRRKHFGAVLPQSVDVEAFLGCAAGALYANPKLMAAARGNPDSLITVLMRCAALGHLPGTDEFYLYNRKRKGREEVAGTEGYRGIIERMYRSGAVAKVVVREVCENDKFRYVEGIDDKPFHSFGGEGGTGADFFGSSQARRDRGEMVGVYAYAELTTGSVSRVVLLTRDDIMAAKESSDAKDSEYSPWNRMDGGKDHPEFQGRSMWWKTGARRLEPWVPTSREYRASMLNASAEAAELAAPRRQAVAGDTPVPAIAPPPDVVDAELVDEPAEVPPAGQPETRPPAGKAAGTGKQAAAAGVAAIVREFTRLGITDQAERFRWAAELANVTSITSFADLTADKQATVAKELAHCSSVGDIADLLADGSVNAEAGDGQ